jgi:hypothetical protein
MLDIIGTGQSVIEAENAFAQEFDYIFTRYNELAVSQLSDRLLLIKNILNNIVLKVENI